MLQLLKLAYNTDLSNDELTENIKTEIDRALLYDVFKQLCSQNDIKSETRFNKVTETMLNKAFIRNSETVGGLKEDAIVDFKATFLKAAEELRKIMEGKDF